MEHIYKISEVSKLVGVENHVLRYWEEELQLDIHRDEMGHRYYSDADVARFQRIALLREKGCQLKAIREMLPELQKQEGTEISVQERAEDIIEEDAGVANTYEMKQIPPEFSFENDRDWEEQMMQIIMRALSQYDQCTAMFWRRHMEARNEMLEDLLSQILMEMDDMMEAREAREEERFRHLDETIRAMQRSRAETAATTTFFGKLSMLFGKRDKKE